MIRARLSRHAAAVLLIFAMIVVAEIYWPGLSGSWLFDDYPNIVDNQGVQPNDTSIPSLVRAALSSPSSEFKRPLASLSFAANYLATGLNPYWMKLTNLVIHLLNGLLIFLLARIMLRVAQQDAADTLVGATSDATLLDETPERYSKYPPATRESIATESAPTDAMSQRGGIVAALIAASWMLLPINLTAVLYVVQRMESMANLFVLLGLIGYVAGRRQMLAATSITPSPARRGGLEWGRFSSEIRGFILCLFSITLSTAIGLLAKETAVMLPLYALLVEWMLFHFRGINDQRDGRIIGGFAVLLVLPMLIGLCWLLPGLLKPEAWATRDFTLGTRLLSESRIVIDYIIWTFLPTPHALSFYHDDFDISTRLMMPWSTLISLVCLAGLVLLMLWLRPRKPLAALGIALFLGCQLLTGTILPLELIYEHRNYFASFGLLLVIVPMLVPETIDLRSLRASPIRPMLLACLMLWWAGQTTWTAYAWGDPLRLARTLAERAPDSPRAQYELGRTYMIQSHYDPASPFTPLVYAPLERAAALPKSSILPQQALIFMNARMHLPLKDAWWNSMIAKLKAHTPGVQDESSLRALTQCAREGQCALPADHMQQAFIAALSHPDPSAGLLAAYGDYAWDVLDDHALGLRMAEEAVTTKPDEPAYRITLVRRLAAQGRKADAYKVLKQLEGLNIGGRLDGSLGELRALLGFQWDRNSKKPRIESGAPINHGSG